ncbi:MAG: radical SAM protein [Lentisphaerae bacterium]|nr:radical SAM protein [Lentisphaerota bacterium]
MKLALVNMTPGETEPPLGLAYIAAYLREYAGFDGTVIIDEADPLAGLRRERPDLIGISALSFRFPAANRLAGRLKAEMPDVPRLIGGYHITTLPRHLAPSHFDIGVLGEGEATAAELVRLFLEKGAFRPEDLRRIQGLVFRNEQGENEITGRRPLIQPLDRVPYPALDLLDMRHAYLVPRRGMFQRIGVYVAMLTSRGCPYRCAFCSPTEFWGKFRMFSPERVVEEIAYLAGKYDVDGIYIWDDLFAVNKQRLAKIVDLLEARGLIPGLRFCIFSRANLLNEDTVRLLKRMGVEGIFLGLESGSQPILDYLKRGTVKVEDNIRALDLCRRHGIHTVGTFIMGAPDETESDIRETLKLMEHPGLHHGIACHLTPLPGTAVWEEAKARGLVSEAIDWHYESLEGWTFHRDLVLNRHMGVDELAAWHQRMAGAGQKKSFSGGVGVARWRYLVDPRFLKHTAHKSRRYLKYMRRRILG